jgi:hypothetical protein
MQLLWMQLKNVVMMMMMIIMMMMMMKLMQIMHSDDAACPVTDAAICISSTASQTGKQKELMGCSSYKRRAAMQKMMQ